MIVCVSFKQETKNA